MDKEQLNFDMRQGVPCKFLEIMMTSPVFYNTNLIPNLSKFKYQSHFKRAQFTDTEKILLIMGFNKFKHLPKLECCECIKEHLLPQRSCDDIRKQLNYFSSSEQRQNQLKELLKKQKQLDAHLLKNYEFDKDIHYKSPFDQCNSVNLPSQYTIIIERIKLAQVLRDTRKNLKDKDKAKEKNNQSSTSSSITITNLDSSSGCLTKALSNTDSNVSTKKNKQQENIELPKINREPKIRPPITKIATQKRHRSQSPQSQPSSPAAPPSPSVEPTESSSIFNNIEPSSPPPRSPSPIVLSSSSPSPEKRSENIAQNNENINLNKTNNINNRNDNSIIINNNAINKNNQPTRILISNNGAINSFPITSLSIPTSSFMIPSTNIFDLFTRPSNLTNPTIIPNIQTIPQQNIPQNPAQLPCYLPNNFSGTVLIQPTIHIHTRNINSNFNLEKFRQIKPKEQVNGTKTMEDLGLSNPSKRGFKKPKS